MKFKFLITILPVLAILACQNKKNQSADIVSDSASENSLTGYIYTTTNGKGENQVVQLSRYADGSLGDEKIYPTGGNGGSDHDAPAHGDYDNQGSLQLIDNYLFTVNTGDHSVSIFNVDKSNGNLSFSSKFESMGQRPVSIAYNKKSSGNGYWIIVGNQWGTPTVLYNGADKKRYPSDAFYKENLEQADESDQQRNIVLFDFNPSNGEVTYVKTLDNYVRQWGGPAQVSFSPDGKKLGVTLWGIPHFLTPEPELEETRPSRFVVYDFNNGEINNMRYYEDEGVVGAVGFSWADDNQTAYVSYFNVVPSKLDNGLVVLKDAEQKLTKISNHATHKNGEVDEACWTVLSPDKDRLYVASFGTNVVTPFKLNLDHTIDGVLTSAGVMDKASHDDLKDMYVTNDNAFLYCLGSFSSFSVKIYKITEAGLEINSEYVLEETKDAIGKPGFYDLGGIVGFDL